MSSIPKDATHRDAGGCILKWSGTQWQQWQDRDGYWFIIGDHNVNRPLTEVNLGWPSEGFPEAGTVCEVTTNDGHNWRAVRILFLDEFIILAGEVEGKVDRQLLRLCDADVSFRPIRTPEQIAADERAKASVELAGILAGHDQHIAVRDIEMAKYLYDIGYRKEAAK